MVFLPILHPWLTCFQMQAILRCNPYLQTSDEFPLDLDVQLLQFLREVGQVCTPFTHEGGACVPCRVLLASCKVPHPVSVSLCPDWLR